MDYFKDAEESPTCRSQHESPGGQYRLDLTSIATKPGCWSYTRGRVYRGEQLIATIDRNYSAFPHLFVEGHPKGDFLICGSDYQGQTVVNLLTGERKDVLSEGADKGAGFCWSSYRYEAQHGILVVDGCFWACPYEFRFYEFSDPMRGWPELTMEKQYVDADRREPVFNPDGTITCFQTEYDEDAEDDVLLPVAATKTFRREGMALVLVEEWVSDKEKETRARREESQRRYDEWVKNFRATDPLYLAMLDGIKDPAFSPENYDGIGITYDTWCPGFTLQEKRCTRRIQKMKVCSYTMDLEWAAETGPVKLVVYRDGKHLEDRFWHDHSADSIRAALLYGKELMG